MFCVFLGDRAAYVVLFNCHVLYFHTAVDAERPPRPRLQPRSDTFTCSQRYTLAPAGPAVTPLAHDGAHRIP